MSLLTIVLLALYVVAASAYTYHHAFRLRFMHYHNYPKLREESDALDALFYALKWSALGFFVAPFIAVVWLGFEVSDLRLPQPYRRYVRECKHLAAELFRARQHGAAQAEEQWAMAKDTIDDMREHANKNHRELYEADARESYARVQEMANLLKVS